MLESLLATYGYPILIVGTFLEGETVLILGGIAAHLGYLSIAWIIICGFFGTLLGDQLYFMLGRRHGKKILAKHPNWQTPANRVFKILELHQTMLILGFRFLYGIRTVTPFAIGMTAISYVRFTILNIIGAATWAICIALAGYYFGKAMEIVLGDIKKYEIEIMAVVAVLASLIWLLHLYRQRKQSDA